ncbi:MAG: ankyrin repeat domain-containing protein [Chlamydiales bacterium]
MNFGFNIVWTKFTEFGSFIASKVRGSSHVEKVAQAALARPGAIPVTIDTTLHEACENGDLKTVKTLLQSRDALNLVSTPDLKGVVPLLYACMNGHEEIAELLLDAGADVNSRDPAGGTAFYYACIAKSWNLARLLMDYKGDANLQGAMGFSPLIHVIEDENWVEFLLENGADVNVIATDGSTALSRACADNNTRIVQLLLEQGARPNQGVYNFKGKELPPLHLACKHNNFEITKMLIEAGADVHFLYEGETPFDAIALENHNGPLVALLLNHDAEPDLQKKMEIVALHPQHETRFTGIRDQQLVAAKKLAHANHIGNQKHTEIEYERWHEQIFYRDFAKVIEESGLYTRHERAKLAKAFLAASKVPFDVQSGVRNIRKDQPVIVPSGWLGHRLSAVFYGGYLAICNRGEGVRKTSVEIYKFEHGSVNEQIIQELIDAPQKLSSAAGQAFIYGTLLKKLSCKEDAFSKKMIKATISSTQVVENCPFASCAGALSALLGLFATIDCNQRPETLAGIREDTRELFLTLRLNYLEHYLELNPHGDEEFLAQESWKKMKKRVREYADALDDYPMIRTQLSLPSNEPFHRRAIVSVKKRVSRIKERVEGVALDILSSALIPSYVI